MKNEPWYAHSFGGAACMVAALFTHPLYTLKVRLQIQGLRQGNMLLNMIKNEGLISLYRGLSASLLREATYSTLRMGLYSPIKGLLVAEGEQISLFKKILAGGIAGMIGSACATPTDLIKIRFQAQGHSSGLLVTIKDIVSKEGIQGLYRGVIPTTQRAVILTASQLPAYDQSKEYFSKKGWFEEGLALHFSASTVAGAVCAVTTSPVDVVKSRYMNQAFDANGKGKLYSSSLDCLVKTAREGPLALFKGIFPSWLRISPHSMITFIVLEKLRLFAGLEPF